MREHCWRTFRLGIPIRRLIPLFVALAGLGFSCAPAGAAPQLGVNVANYPDDAAIQAALATGAKTIRIFVNWPDFEPNNAAQFPNRTPGYSTHAAGNIVDDMDRIVSVINAGGAKPIFTIWRTPSWANGTSDPFVPPTDPSDYANFAGAFAKRYAGQVAGYEVWSEEDLDAFWNEGPYDPKARAEQYVPLLRAAHHAIAANDPAATVIAGPLVANDYPFLAAMYAAGAGGTFDAVAVHTDTACLVTSPDQYYIDKSQGNRIGQFSFLGYREVHQTMVDNGDGAKPIFMTEIGWSSTNGGATSCQRGQSAGQKPSGVTDQQQADYLNLALACMAQDPYVTLADWFMLKDGSGGPVDELDHYGLLAADGSQKPVYSVFHTAATQGIGGTACSAQQVPSSGPAPPQNGENVDVLPVSGIVYVRLPGQPTSVRLTAGRQLPIGTVIDVTHGRITLESQAAGGTIQKADFYGGMFVIGQKKGQSITTLTLRGGAFASCRMISKHRRRDVARAAGSRKARRHLWGSGKGHFETVGRSASATVHGTQWLTEDSCDGTLIRVAHGVVLVTTNVHHHSKLVHAPHAYFARLHS
jgi:hypothetical protein